MKKYKEKTNEELEKIEYFKKIIIDIALSEKANFRSIHHRLFYDSILACKPLPSKGYLFKDLMTPDDMKLYIIAWKQVLPEIEEKIRQKKILIKKYMREQDYANIPEHLSFGLKYLYNFRFNIRIFFRRKNGYRKPLTNEQKKIVVHYENIMIDYVHSGTLGQAYALKTLLKLLDQKENYWLFIIAYKKAMPRIEKRIRGLKALYRKKKQTYFNPNVTLLYTIRNVMRERVRNIEGKTK
jgi:ribosomal protein L21